MSFCIMVDNDLEKSRLQGKISGTIGFLDLKNIDLETKTVKLSVLVKQVMVKDILLVGLNMVYFQRKWIRQG